MDKTNLDIYGHAPLPWSRAEKQLESTSGPAVTHFLSTVRPDGRPHVAGIGAVWVDGKFYFVSGAQARKSRNLAETVACAIAVKLPDMDLVVEGYATKVTDQSTLERLAERYNAEGWPAGGRRQRVHGPVQRIERRPGTRDLYEFAPTTAFGVATAEPHGATRWRFNS